MPKTDFFYPIRNENWITQGRPLTMIGERQTPRVKKRWDSMFSGLIFFKIDPRGRTHQQ